jgi:hypothetical protein
MRDPKGKCHLVFRQEPITVHGQDQEALCGYVVPRAIPLNQVWDITLASVAMIADTFQHMCFDCQTHDEPPNGLAYFMIAKEDEEKFRRPTEYAEVG